MFFKTCATLALATGFAAAKPIHAPRAEELPAYRRGTSTEITKRNNGLGGNNGFNFIDGFNNFNNQEQVIQIQEQNLQIIDNGFQQQVVQQANEVLIVNQQQNGFNNDLNNLFRKANFRNNFNQVSTVMLVVQEIQIAVDNGFGGQFQQNVFAQSAVVANRGFGQTQTVMVFASETLIAQDILGGGFGGVGVGGGVGFDNGSAPLPTQTANVQLLGQKPTWSSVADDPAATLGGVWQAELEDAQNADNNGADNACNDQAAAEEKKALDEAKNQEQQNNEQQNQDQQNAEENKDQQNADEQNKDQQNADEQNKDQQNAEEQQNQEGQDQAAEGEDKAAEGEQKQE